MSKETIKEKMATLKTQIDCLKVQFQDESKVLFSEETQELFKKYPNMESFSWTQYTPYFNDGDTCEFGVNAYSDSIDINGVNEYDEDDENIGLHQPWMAEAREEISKFVEQFDEEVLEKMFGDHARVVVYKDKVDVEQYDHD